MSILGILMRILVYGLLIAAISNGCTTINIINDRLDKLMYVDSGLRKDLSAFLAEANKRKIKVSSSKLTMIFGKTNTKDDKGVVGVCTFMNGLPLITIDEDYWSYSDDYDHEELVFHELGHCLLLRDHCEVKNSKGESVSMMEPDMLGSRFYSDNREALVNELFKPNEGCSKTSTQLDGIHVRIH